MKKPISRPLHGLADYSYAVFVAAAPNLIGFKEEKKPTNVCRLLSGGVVLYTASTRAEWGLIRVIPFKVHLAADFLGNILVLGAPWLFGFSHNKRARNTFLATGAVGLAVGLLTSPEEMID
jgi:hypothetical protein